LTSITKRMDATVLEVIKAAMDGSFAGGVLTGTLANGGVDLAPYHDLDAQVPPELKAEMEALRKGIIDGTIAVGG
jgi:basic membrane protein A and related proteins